MRWWIKAAAQKVLSALPGYQRLNFAWQRSRWGSLQLSDFFLEDRLGHARRHLTAWQDVAPDESPSAYPEKVLEFGTGWYPVVPLALRMCGVAAVWTVDARPHLRPALIRELVETLVEWEQSGNLSQYIPLFESPLPWLQELLKGPLDQAHLAQVGIHYVITEVEHLPPSLGDFPLIVSNNTLEHIPADGLSGIFKKLKTQLAEEGIMSHYTDHADHFSYTDPRISPYHFLRFSPDRWKWINSSLSFQNRLRVSQLRNLFLAEGLELVGEELEYGEDTWAAQEPLHSNFARLPWEEWGVTYSHLILRKKTG